MLERRKVTPPEMQMGPLIDCVFLLLIFFMVSTVMRVNPPFQVLLPDSQVRQDFPRKKLNVYVSAAGQISLDDLILPTLDDLEESLAINENKIETLIIKADKSSRHGVVVDVMERAKRRAIENIAIAVKEGDYAGGL
ncbi:biopolymer transporter ExbD [Candidatus Poribacteria bacterium]|nr:biopolymer transporter ExbD [Candidatus Poribacteria bacterium]